MGQCLERDDMGVGKGIHRHETLRHRMMGSTRKKKQFEILTRDLFRGLLQKRSVGRRPLSKSSYVRDGTHTQQAHSLDSGYFDAWVGRMKDDDDGGLLGTGETEGREVDKEKGDMSEEGRVGGGGK